MRLSGHLKIRAEAREDGRSFLASQSFQAPFHLGKAYWECDSKVLVAQIVNPTAGMLEGDELESEIGVRADASLLVTSPSASRAFSMRAGRAECRQSFAVDTGGWLEVLPEPLVPHRGTRFRQSTTIDVAAGAGLFFVDMLMPGRIAHGDSWKWDSLEVALEARSCGRLILRERLDYRPEKLKALAEAAGSGDEACFGNAILIGPDLGAAPGWRDAVNALHTPGLWIGASRLEAGAWSIKFVASGSSRLRETLRNLRRLLSAEYPRLVCDPRKL